MTAMDWLYFAGAPIAAFAICRGVVALVVGPELAIARLRKMLMPEPAQPKNLHSNKKRAVQ